MHGGGVEEAAARLVALRDRARPVGEGCRKSDLFLVSDSLLMSRMGSLVRW